MTMTQPYRGSVRAGVLALAVLAGCAKDDEAEVRAELGDWVTPGATLYFQSRLGCTAARFETRSPRPLPGVAMAQSLADVMRHVAAERTVAFNVEGHSPTRVSEEVMRANLPGGIGLLSAGVGGKACMDDAEQARYVTALNDPGVVMIYAPQGNALVLLDTGRREVFFVRGDV
ncbi:MAG: hypothetical protein OQK05_09300 [Pseudopelagicola sp.]|nr:hypothetical protein [Pseudopelagicola sp.]